MKVLVEQKDLAAALATGAAVAAKNSPIPVLNHVRLIAEGSSLRVASTNLDIFAEARADAAIDKPGAVTVPAARLVALVSKFPAVQVLLSLEGAHLIVKAGRSRSKLETLPAADFPAWADDTFTSRFTMPAAVFTDTFARCRPAASTEETRYYLQGVFAHVDGLTMRFAATNGAICIETTTLTPASAADWPAVIVPHTTIDAVARAMKSASEVEIEASASKIAFTTGRARIVSKLVDGTFPDYRRVIPDRGGRVCAFDRKPFAESLERAVLATEEGTHSAVIIIPRGEGVVELKGGNSSGGETRDEIDGVDLDPGFAAFGVNPTLMRTALNAFQGERVTIEQSDGANGPQLFHSPDEPDVRLVLMPVRINPALAA